MTAAGVGAACPEVRLACAAMRTRFELVLRGDDPVLLRAAGEEALEEVHATERELSRFRKDALCARVNRDAAAGPVAVTARFLDVLACCRAVAAASGGAFDPTTRADGSRDAAREDRGRGAAAGATGLDAVRVDPNARTVRFLRADLALDFGGVGKGVALDRARAVLADAGVTEALLHGGTSTTVAVGGPWPVAVPRDPDDPAAGLLWSEALRDEALSVSADAQGRRAAVRIPLAADAAARADAWSTALLVADPDPAPFRLRRLA